LEPGLAPGTWRFSLTTLYGSNFEGSHLSTEGTSPTGADVTVPQYRHDVSLDYARVELGLQYTLTNEWDVLARIPYEHKQQTAGLGVIESATADERAAMQRNIDVHHRSITLRGLGDLQFLGRRRWSRFAAAFGATVPTGKTVENPYDLGDRGLEHLHIQFGTGTIDPLLELTYTMPTFGASLSARVPLYENDRTFRAPPEGTLAVYGARRLTARTEVRLEGALYAQGYGAWDGKRDENTGLVGTSIAAGLTRSFRNFALSADVRYPLSQRTLEEGDTFTQGPTFVLGVRWQRYRF
jgi:hypothetical protein